jgi:hypothetical protein
MLAALSWRTILLTLLQIVDLMNLFYVFASPGPFILANSVAPMVYAKHAFLTRHNAFYSKVA